MTEKIRLIDEGVVYGVMSVRGSIDKCDAVAEYFTIREARAVQSVSYTHLTLPTTPYV